MIRNKIIALIKCTSIIKYIIKKIFNIDMKNTFINIKNSLPYLLLISIYFFFVNIEARKDRSRVDDINKIIEVERKNMLIRSDSKPSNVRVSIPVIPYTE